MVVDTLAACVCRVQARPSSNQAGDTCTCVVCDQPNMDGASVNSPKAKHSQWQRDNAQHTTHRTPPPRKQAAHAPLLARLKSSPSDASARQPPRTKSRPTCVWCCGCVGSDDQIDRFRLIRSNPVATHTPNHSSHSLAHTRWCFDDLRLDKNDVPFACTCPAFHPKTQTTAHTPLHTNYQPRPNRRQGAAATPRPSSGLPRHFSGQACRQRSSIEIERRATPALGVVRLRGSQYRQVHTRARGSMRCVLWLWLIDPMQRTGSARGDLRLLSNSSSPEIKRSSTADLILSAPTLHRPSQPTTPSCLPLPTLAQVGR